MTEYNIKCSFDYKMLLERSQTISPNLQIG